MKLREYCPFCGHKFDPADCVSREGCCQKPSPGDYTVCIECGGWLVFRDDFSYRKVDALDLRDMDNEIHLALMNLSKVVKEAQR